MFLIIPILAGLGSSFVATALGHPITSVDYWAISAPTILLGAVISTRYR